MAKWRPCEILVQKAFREWKVENGCAACGYNEHHFALQLDHILPIGTRKRKPVYSSKAFERLKSDPNIQILCHTCHSIKTRKSGDYKSRTNKESKFHQMSPSQQASFRTSTRKRQAIQTYQDGVKLARGCKICGYNAHYAGLHFDHISPVRRKKSEDRGGPRMTTMTKAYEMANDSNIQILCCNCHSIKTWENKDYLAATEENR